MSGRLEAAVQAEVESLPPFPVDLLADVADLLDRDDERGAA